MAEGVVEKVMAARASVSGLGQQAARLRASASEAVTDAIEDVGLAAKRAAKRGYNKAEDLIDETSHRIKRSPLRAVTTCFFLGMVTGALVGRLFNRRSGA
jgi:ElaB/YqjD/DUF883 family membrane-anchored ribosome-binding protein